MTENVTLEEIFNDDIGYIMERRRDLTYNQAVQIIQDVLFNHLSDEVIDNYEVQD